MNNNRLNHRFCIQNSRMEKISWKQVRQTSQGNNLPGARWGHSCCRVQDEILFFGGYADSNYMNDVWSFHTITMEWREVAASGDIPSPRSNCSMNYDPQHHRVILFGGGGPNKARYNSVHFLDCSTHQWTQTAIKANERAPWERTYHTGELFGQYLVTFGGEATGDLDDLWIFDLETLRWREVRVEGVRPCARRFHSSVALGNQFFVIAGCYGKYRCLSDIYSLDLSDLLKGGRSDRLEWRERRMRDSPFLTRWGHTSAVWQDKIVVFGGRFCNDLSDVLVLDVGVGQVSFVKAGGESPKARRRHSACLVGSSMVVFGGFNGEYFNDLHYVNLRIGRKRIGVEGCVSAGEVERVRGLRGVEWEAVGTSEGGQFEVCVGLLIHRFSSIYHFDSFFREIEGKYSLSELEQLIFSLYRGYGSMDSSFAYQFGIAISDSREEYLRTYRASIAPNEREGMSVRPKPVQAVILLEEGSYLQHLEERRAEECYFDVTLNLNDEAYFRANKSVLAAASPYFACLFSTSYRQAEQEVIKMTVDDVVLFETLLNYLSSRFVVASAAATHAFWAALLEMADYFVLPHLVALCEQQLLSYLSEHSCQELLMLAARMGLEVLGEACGEVVIGKMRTGREELVVEKQREGVWSLREDLLRRVYGKNRFDMLQRRLESECVEERRLGLKGGGGESEEKENSEIKN